MGEIRRLTNPPTTLQHVAEWRAAFTAPNDLPSELKNYARWMLDQYERDIKARGEGDGEKNKT